MEFLYSNYLATSTQLAVNSNTLIASQVMLRDPTRQWFSSGLDDDTTIASMTVTFDNTTSISRIALAGLNLKQFRMFYNGATANTFAFSTTAATTSSNFSTNSQTAMFFDCTPVNVTSVTIDMYTTQTPNSEKAIGYLYLGAELLSFPRNPAANNYTPKIDSTEVVHRMSDGGVKINVKDRKHAVDIKFKYVTEDFRDDLRSVYDSDTEFVFVAFPTSSAWDQIMFPCVIEGDFDFYKFSENSPSTGFDGVIRLRETPT